MAARAFACAATDAWCRDRSRTRRVQDGLREHDHEIMRACSSPGGLRDERRSRSGLLRRRDEYCRLPSEVHGPVAPGQVCFVADDHHVVAPARCAQAGTGADAGLRRTHKTASCRFLSDNCCSSERNIAISPCGSNGVDDRHSPRSSTTRSRAERSSGVSCSTEKDASISRRMASVRSRISPGSRVSGDKTSLQRSTSR